MKFFVLLSALFGMLLLPSCEKHNRLIEEVKALDAEIKKNYDELAVIDAKAASFGTDIEVAIMTLESQNLDWAHKNAVIEADLASKSKKCTDGEAAIKEFRPKVDAYKAKYSR